FMLDRLDEGISQRTLARNVVALRRWTHFLRQERVLDVDPCDNVDIPRFAAGNPDFLTMSEVDRLLQSPSRQTPEGIRDLAMLEVLYATGLRVTELVTLRVRDLDLQVGYVRARGKGSKERLVPLGEAAIDAVRRYLENARGELLRKHGRASDDLFVTRR